MSKLKPYNMSIETPKKLQKELVKFKKMKKEKDDVEEKLRLKVFPGFFLNEWESECEDDSDKEDLKRYIKNFMKNVTKAPRTSHQEFKDSEKVSEIIIDTLTYTWENDVIVATNYEDSDNSVSDFVVTKNGEIICIEDEDDEENENEEDKDFIPFGKYFLCNRFLFAYERISNEDYLEKYLEEV